jgi:hypothetical protein
MKSIKDKVGKLRDLSFEYHGTPNELFRKFNAPEITENIWYDLYVNMSEDQLRFSIERGFKNEITDNS